MNNSGPVTYPRGQSELARWAVDFGGYLDFPTFSLFLLHTLGFRLAIPPVDFVCTVYVADTGNNRTHGFRLNTDFEWGQFLPLCGKGLVPNFGVDV